MKKLLTLILALCILLSVGCASNEGGEQSTPAETPYVASEEVNEFNSSPKSIICTVLPGDLDSSGFFRYPIEGDAKYTVISVGENKNDWYVYLTDAETDTNTILEGVSPVINGSGEIEVKSGQFMYIYCKKELITDYSPNNFIAVTVSKTEN